ncbi:hypothetical protein B0T16DRAFT_248212 [Cercophora newfieldiana]|uniref:Uncharacterized protein n=1 Tax=Cercophora newfieldiana TaxID=92897 RepID=A0AA39XU83_9PEZI|nr:hypothetical protein B0T16DRAFT_248212 [Cercophora newfieldiana]
MMPREIRPPVLHRFPWRAAAMRPVYLAVGRTLARQPGARGLKTPRTIPRAAPRNFGTTTSFFSSQVPDPGESCSTRPMGIIEDRQVTAARVITQTLTRASTTITTLVTLGIGSNGDFTTPTAEAPPPPPPPAAPAATSSSSVLTNEQLGAILGSVLGFLVIVVPLVYCCFRRDPKWRRRRHYSDSDSWSSHSGSSGGNNRPRRDPWRGRAPAGPPMRQPAFQPVLVPPPPRIPPRRYAPYRQTAQPQIRGVRVYP